MVCAPPWRSNRCKPVPPCRPVSAAQTMTVVRRAIGYRDRGDDRSGSPQRGQQRRQRGYPPSRVGEANLGRWRTAGRLPLPDSASVRGRNRAARSQGGTARFGRGLVDRERAVRRAANEHDPVDRLRVALGHVTLHHILQDARGFAGKRVAVSAVALRARTGGGGRSPDPAIVSRRQRGRGLPCVHRAVGPTSCALSRSSPA